MALVLAIAAVAAWGVRDALREARPARRRVLVVLRVLTAVMALLVGLQPRWLTEDLEETEGALAVLFDGSRSMTIGAAGERTRAEEAAALVDRWRNAPTAGRVAVLAFDAEPRPTSWEALAARYPVRGDATRLSASLEEATRPSGRGAELGAVVVVSDGAEPTPSVPPELVRRGIRVHTVALGAGGDLLDHAVAAVSADPVAFLREPARARVEVRNTGPEGASIPVALTLDGQVVREVLVDVPADGSAEVVLPFTPARLGRAVYRVSIPLAPGDAVPANNERAFLVRVQRDRLRVLLVAGEPSWDVRFLRGFLKRDPAIDLVSFFILRNSSDLTMAPSSEMALIPFPTDELFREHLGSFDVVFFQNFDYGPYEMGSYLPRLRDYVHRGGSFAMIGGERSLGSGGYAETPVAELLPVRVPPSGTPETRALVNDRFRAELVPSTRQHPIVALLPDPRANAEAWAGLAPLEGANVVLGLRGDGRALLVHPGQRVGGAAMPVLAVGTAGAGRVLALATDTSWRWGMGTAGRTGDASSYERFWDRALRWLARDPSLDASRLETDRERYGSEAPMRVRLVLRDDGYAPERDRAVAIEVLDASGEALASAAHRTDDEGTVETTLPAPSEPGGYRVAARVEGESATRCELGFVVEAGGDELADVRPRPDFMETLAGATRGRFVRSADEAPELSDFDTTRTVVRGVAETAPFAGAWAFLAVLLLFGAEWVLRRRWGLR